LSIHKKEGKVFISDCFFGKRTLPVPGNPDARRQGPEFLENCQNFWQNHALVVSMKDINVSRTIKRLSEKELECFNKFIEA